MLQEAVHKHAYSPHKHASQIIRAPPKEATVPGLNLRNFRRYPVSWSAASNGDTWGMNPFESVNNLQFAIEHVPIKYLSRAVGGAGVIPETVPYDVGETFHLREGRISEASIGLASTTPVLGQYAPTFGWPDDWGFYWEYVDATLFVPEAERATRLKTRLAWKAGFEIDAEQPVIDEIMENWTKLHLTRRCKELTFNGLMWGNGYAEINDNSEATWAQGYGEGDYALDNTGIIYGMPRPLLRWKPATKFYGLKILDSRTIRIQINPQRFDKEAADVETEKYIQRRWAGPLAPTSEYGQAQQTEIDIHPDQMLSFQFNKIGGGIYGYSHFRTVMIVMKGYMLMNQFLPIIVHRRSDPLLHFKFGGVVEEGGTKTTNIYSQEQIDLEIEKYKNRLPGEDLYSNIFLTVEEVMKGNSSNLDIPEFLRHYKERFLFGLGIPMSTAVLSQASAEIKWGALNYEVLEDEVSEIQEIDAEEINRKLIPRLHPNTKGRKANFQFNPVHPEDWRADAAALLPWVQGGWVSPAYARNRLKMPPEAEPTPEELEQLQPEAPEEESPGEGAEAPQESRKHRSAK